MPDRRVHCTTEAFKTAVSLTHVDLSVLAAQPAGHQFVDSSSQNGISLG